MSVVKIHSTDVKSDISYPIKPVKVSDLRKKFFTKGEETSITLGFPYRIPRNLFATVENEKIDVVGMCNMKVTGISKAEKIQFKANDQVLVALHSPTDQMDIHLFDEESDVWLTEELFSIFTEFRFHIDWKQTGQSYEEITFTFTPLVYTGHIPGEGMPSEGILPGISPRDINPTNLIGFTYYTKLLSGSYLCYSGGAASLVRFEGSEEEFVESMTSTLRESIAIAPTIDSSRVRLCIYSKIIEEIIKAIPGEWCHEKSGVLLLSDVSAMEVIAKSENKKQIKEFCKKLDPEAKISNYGFITYYSDEQKIQMEELSNKATKIKYAVYAMLQGLEVPEVDKHDLLFPPHSHTSLEN